MTSNTASLMNQTLEISAPDTEPVLRNLLITQGYHEVSQALGVMVGGGNANWCTFGTWASLTAGRFISAEEVPVAFRTLLERSQHVQGQLARIDDGLRQFHPDVKLAHQENGLFSTVDRVIHDVTDYIAEGNRVVFRELATAFSRFIQQFGNDTSPDERKLQTFLAQYKEGDPQPDEVTRDAQTGKLQSQQRGGQGYLRQSIASYYAARFETDPMGKAQLVLFANALGGVHEQTRLQTYITGSLDALFTHFFHLTCESAVQAKAPALEGLAGRIRELIVPLLGDLDLLWREVSTREMMTLKLPCGVLRLGANLCSEGAQLYPEQLAHLQLMPLHAVFEKYGAVASEELKTRLAQLESAANGLMVKFGLGHAEAIGCKACDWTMLDQRMRYICTLFRSRQQDADILVPPFTAAQTADILARRIPAGPLYR